MKTLFGDEPDPKETYSPEFAAVWAAYPNAKGKMAAWLSCSRMVKRGEATWADLVLAAKNYAKEVAGKDRQYIKHGSTFFGPKGFWRDYVQPVEDGSKEHPFLIHAKKAGRG